MEATHLLLLLFVGFCLASSLYQIFDGMPRLGKMIMSWGRLAVRQGVRLFIDRPRQPDITSGLGQGWGTPQE